jgi:hypothetical protein
MDALGTRTTLRLSAAAEWLVAALFLLATLSVAVLIVRELTRQPARQRRPGRLGAARACPPAMPAGAVSVPVLALADGTELRVGQTLSAIASRLGRSAESGRQEVDAGLLGERLTRFYDFRGQQFILVFEPAERLGEPTSRPSTCRDPRKPGRAASAADVHQRRVVAVGGDAPDRLGQRHRRRRDALREPNDDVLGPPDA